jgi:hypothetical protein
MACLWNSVPTLFEDSRTGVSQRPVLNKIWVLLFVASSVSFIVLFALDVNHLQCPESDLSTTCVNQDNFGADPNGADKAFCSKLVTASCTGIDNSPDAYFQSFAFTGPALAACQQLCPCLATHCSSWPLRHAGGQKGRSPVKLEAPYGLSTVTASQTCQAFASVLKNYHQEVDVSPLVQGLQPWPGASAINTCLSTNPSCQTNAVNFFWGQINAIAGPGIIYGANAMNFMNIVPKPTTANIRCCGTVTGVGVCPGLAAVVGILAGYLSLWFTIMSGMFKLVGLILNRLGHEVHESEGRPDATLQVQSPVRVETAADIGIELQPSRASDIAKMESGAAVVQQALTELDLDQKSSRQLPARMQQTETSALFAECRRASELELANAHHGEVQVPVEKTGAGEHASTSNLVATTIAANTESHTSETGTGTPKTVIHHPWEEALSDDGEPYYHNTETGETAWDMPV